MEKSDRPIFSLSFSWDFNAVLSSKPIFRHLLILSLFLSRDPELNTRTRSGWIDSFLDASAVLALRVLLKQNAGKIGNFSGSCLKESLVWIKVSRWSSCFSFNIKWTLTIEAWLLAFACFFQRVVRIPWWFLFSSPKLWAALKPWAGKNGS